MKLILAALLAAAITALLMNRRVREADRRYTGLQRRQEADRVITALSSAYRSIYSLDLEIDNEKSFRNLFNSINAIAARYDMPVLYSCHPRSRKKLEATGFQLDERVIRHEPLGFHDYNCLQMNAFCVISDSGTLPEESSFYTSIGHPIPAVCIRDSTERPEALDKGCFVLAGVEDNTVLQSVELAIEMVRNGDNGIPVPDYTDLNVSSKVVKIIQSYVGIINKNTWRKY